MYTRRRSKNSLGWYPGPFLINLITLAEEAGCDVGWFERIMSEPPSGDRQERTIDLAVVESFCEQIRQLSPQTLLSDIMRRQTGPQTATSLVAMSLGEPTLKAILTRAAATSLLNANLFTYRFEKLPSRKTYALSFLPIAPIPRWLHMCFAYQFAEGLARTTGISNLEVEEVVLCGASVAQRTDLDDLTDAGVAAASFADSAPSRVVYKAGAVDQVNPLANKSFRNWNNSMVNPLLSSRLKTAPWTYRSYMMILRHFDAGLSLSMEAISNSLGADVSTLRRYLQAESTGFKEVVALFRKQQAQLMMIDGVSFDQMAQRLDFKNSLSVKRLIRTGPSCGKNITAVN